MLSYITCLYVHSSEFLSCGIVGCSSQLNFNVFVKVGLLLLATKGVGPPRLRWEVFGAFLGKDGGLADHDPLFASMGCRVEEVNAD